VDIADEVMNRQSVNDWKSCFVELKGMASRTALTSTITANPATRIWMGVAAFSILGMGAGLVIYGRASSQANPAQLGSEG
jgi:hypothetical protein